MPVSVLHVPVKRVCAESLVANHTVDWLLRTSAALSSWPNSSSSFLLFSLHYVQSIMTVRRHGINLPSEALFTSTHSFSFIPVLKWPQRGVSQDDMFPNVWCEYENLAIGLKGMCYCLWERLRGTSELSDWCQSIVLGPELRGCSRESTEKWHSSTSVSWVRHGASFRPSCFRWGLCVLCLCSGVK